MDVTLGWLGIAVGVVGFTITYLQAGGLRRVEASPELSSETRRAWIVAGFTAVITLIFWGISMRRTVPFSMGQTLGYGFLIGGLAGAGAALRAFKLETAIDSYRSRCLAANAMAFHGLFVVSATYLIFRGYPQTALIGFAIGAAMATILRFYTQGVRSTRSAMLTEIWAVFSITLAAAIVLAVYHFDTDSLRTWWPLPILIAATVCVASFIGIQIGGIRRFEDRSGLSYVLALLISTVITIGLSVLYSAKVVQSYQLLGVVAVGIGITAIIAWLIASVNNQAGGLEAASASVLLLIAGVVVAFKLWTGLGIALGLIAGWIAIFPAFGLRQRDNINDSAVVRGLVTAMALGLSIIIFRLFIETYRSNLGTTDIRIHYTSIGALLGAIAPFIFASSLMRLKTLCGRESSITADLCAILGITAIGFLAAGSPIVLFAIWGIKAVLGFVFGLIAAAAFLPLMQLFDQASDRLSVISFSVSILIIGAQLTALQFVGPLLEWEGTRATRIWILAGAGAIALLWLGATALAARRGAGRV